MPSQEEASRHKIAVLKLLDFHDISILCWFYPHADMSDNMEVLGSDTDCVKARKRRERETLFGNYVGGPVDPLRYG